MFRYSIYSIIMNVIIIYKVLLFVVAVLSFVVAGGVSGKVVTVFNGSCDSCQGKYLLK